MQRTERWVLPRSVRRKIWDQPLSSNTQSCRSWLGTRWFLLSAPPSVAQFNVKIKRGGAKTRCRQTACTRKALNWFLGRSFSGTGGRQWPPPPLNLTSAKETAWLLLQQRWQMWIKGKLLLPFPARQGLLPPPRISTRNTLLLCSNAADFKFTFYCLHSFLTASGEVSGAATANAVGCSWWCCGSRHCSLEFLLGFAVWQQAWNTERKSLLDPNTKRSAFYRYSLRQFHLALFLRMNFKITKQNSHTQTHVRWDKYFSVFPNSCFCAASRCAF